MGHTVVFMQYEKDELPCSYEWVEGVVCNGLFLSHPIEKFTNLRYIQLTSAGFDRVDMDYVKAHGIEIHNARGVYSIPMAEFALSGVATLGGTVGAAVIGICMAYWGLGAWALIAQSLGV